MDSFFLYTNRRIMAKNKKSNKYFENHKKDKIDIRNKHFDFGFYATEYKKLLEKKYFILLDNGEVFSISFDEGNFFHLLGFHKFENTLFYSMINDETINYTQQNFFEDVYNGNIWYEGFNENKIQIPEKFKDSTLIHSFKEHELTDKTKHTLEDRFPYFSYENILKILKNKLVINFEKDKSEYKVRASRILFYFLSDKKRNLNMFVDGEKECFVTSFYLESKKDIYKYKIDGTKMKTFDVLCLYIEDTQNYQGIEFTPDWVKIRNLVGDGCEKYEELKTLLKKGRICTKLLEDELDQIIEKISETKIEIEKLQEENQILRLKYSYYTEDDQEESALRLMDYDIDIEEHLINEIEIKNLQKLIDKTNTKILNINNLLKRLEDKKQRISLTTSDIETLDINVIKRIYIPLIKNSEYWNEEFWKYFIHNYEYQKENINPRQLKKMYTNWSGEK